MKKTVFERLAALLCAAAMVLTILPLPAAAEDGAVPTISVETYSVAQGGSATVYVYGKNLTSFHTLTMNLFYDSEILTYKSCSSSSMEYALGNGETAGQVTVSAIHSRGLTVSGTSRTLLFRLYFDVNRNAPLGETPLQIDITYASDATGTIMPNAVNGTLKVTEYVTPVVTFTLKGNSAVQAGERLELILNSSNLRSLCGGQFAFQYDDKVFRYESLELLSAMQTDTAVQSVYAQNSGQVILSYASATKPASGDLMKLTLTALENAEGETEISLRPTSLYDVNREVLQSTSVSKTVTVTKLEVQPVFPKVWLDIPEDMTMDQPFTVTVMVSGDGNISAADMQFTYDSTLLEVTDVAPAQSSKEDFSGLTVTANPAKFQNGKGVFTVISMDGITEETALVNITLKALENPPSAADWETQIAVSASGVVDRTGDDVVVQPGTSLLTIQVPVYTVTFLEHDGTLLKQQPVFYLNAAAAPEVQGKEANDQQHFLHSGWDHDFSVITTDLTVTAVYQAEAHNFEDAVWQRKDEQLHVRTCTGCTVQESASHQWDEGKETTAPGCITAGVMTYICTDCSAVREEDIAALDHDWDEGTVTTPATCTGDGILTKSCSRCDQKQLETIKAPGHQESAPVKENIVAATCTSKGSYDEVAYCSVCHEALKRTPYETEKLPHTEGQAVQENYRDATCTENGGYDMAAYCTVCKTELSRVSTTLEAPGHNYAEAYTVDKEPTCTAEGSKSRHCSACDSVTDVTVIEALGHDWDAGVVTTAPTCTADGVLTETCTRCKATQTKAITAAGHKEDSAVWEKIVEATCTAAGSYDEVIYCSVCHAELSRIPNTIPMLAHTEGQAVQEKYQAATCTQDGGYDMATYCTVCKTELSRVHTTLEAPGHDYAEVFTVDKVPTCTAEGSKSRHCSACDSVTDVTVIEALGHDWDAGVVTTAPTCTADGVLTETCTRCSQQQTEAIKAPGHQESDPVKENIVPATCTSKGSYDEVVYCAVCDAVLKRTPHETEKLAHAEGQAVQENYRNATCTQDGGYDMATYCTVCKAELSRLHTTLEAPGHDYADAYTVDKAPTCTAEGSKSRHCSVCDDATDVTVIEALGHDWDEGVVTTAPTCTADGVLTRTCTRCSQQQTEAMKAPGHQESTPVKENIVPATCTSKGSYDEVVYCAVCDAVLKRTPHETEKLAHTEGQAVQENYRDATCTQDGGYDTVIYCTVCKVELSRVSTTLEAPGHDYAEDFTVDTAPTCTAEGSKSRHCSACNSVTDVTVIEALGHDWDEGVVTTAPTCTADGVLTRTCTRCSQQQTEAMKAPGHQESTPVKENIVPATCTSKGSYDEVVYCAVCDAVLKRTPHETEKLAHTEGQAVQENYQDATCTENGGYDMVIYCTVCKAELSRVSTTLEAPGHDYAEAYTVDKAPTCTAEGSKSRHCSVCDDATDVTVIEALGHDWDEGVVTTAPTCTADGILTETCIRCDAIQTKAITAAGHEEDSVVRENIVDATCTASGSYDEVIYCSVCDAELSRVPNTIPLLAHTEGDAVQEETVDSTCTSAGSYDLVTYCTVCHQELSREHQDTAAAGHDYDEDFTIDNAPTCTEAGSKSRHCSRCDSRTDITAIEALDHDWNEGSITKEPSCTETGVKTKICLRCSQSMTETVAAKGHTSGEPVQENPVAPTCTETGSYETVVYCSVCSAEISKSLQTVEKLGHAPNDAVTENRVEPACEAKGGYDTVTYCGRCSAELSRVHTVIDALGHDYAEEYTVDKEPTCTAEGSKSRHCSRCESKTDITAIEELGHARGEEIVKAATCTEDGSVTKSCSRCNATEITTLPALGHTHRDAVRENEKAPSCTETGSYESVVYCSVCNAEISRSLQTVEKLGHAPKDAVTENRVESSCEVKGGYDTVIYCGRCSSELSRVHTVIDVLGHDYAEEYTVDKEPTCTAEGSKSRHCSRCESKADITAIEELGHAWGEEIVKAATCTEDGSVTKSCSRCNATEITTLPALGHTHRDEVRENEKVPSCTENGSYESVVYCSVCNAEISRSLQTVEKLGHAPKDSVTENRVEPSCEAKGGYDTVTYCGRCSSELSRVHTVIDVLGHDYAEEYTVDKEPTCTAEGSKSRHCSRCESKADITAIEELGHAWGEEIVKAATCTEDGSVTKSCSRCDVTEVTTLSALGHTHRDAVKENEKAPSCTETGSYESVVYCSVCSAEISRSLQTVEKLGHAPKDAVTENRVEPACEAKGGYDTVIYCGRCSAELSRVHTVLDALGHDYAEEYTVDKEPTCTAEGSKSRHCSRCESKADITAIAELGHAWGEEIIKAATCTEDGSVTKNCSRCNATEVITLSALGHTHRDAVKENEKAPGCTENGSYESVVYCSVCNAEISRSLQTVEKLGHAPKDAVTENRVEPSCEVKGGYDTVIYCGRCSSELSRVHTVIDALGHDYAEEYTVDKVPTCTAEGSKSRHCSRCESKTDITAIAELGHAWGEEIVKAATCTVDGSVTKSCSRCNVTESTVISALGHKPGSTAVENEKKPNCVDAGSHEEVVRCTVCNTELSRKTVTVSALGHTAGEETEENRVEPTCQADGGYELASYCQVCHKELKRSTVVLTKLGHDYAKSFTVDQEATCTSVGSKSRHCSRCDSKTEVIELAALGHSWDEGIITTAPTCTENGIRTKTCIRCDATKDEGINALGHVYNAAVRENEVAASCMAAGSYDSVIYCAVCQTEISRISKVIEMLAHTLGQPTVENEREPSCTVDGGYDTVVRCTVCNTVVSGEHTVIGKLGHAYGKPSFQWADDLKTCTASFYCNACEEDTENKLLTVSCSVTENETESASCSKEGKKTITAMAVLGETVYTEQKTQSIPMTDHRVDAWIAEGIEGHSAVCKDCKKTVKAAHNWQDHACSLCGQKDAYLALDGDMVTVFAVNIEAGTKILIAGYAEGGRCISVVAADWGTENDLKVQLPNEELVQKVYVYFVDQDWTPIRSYIEQ